MELIIRLVRQSSSKKKPFYSIVVADSRSQRDDPYIEKIGTYNPMTKPATIELDRDRAYEYLIQGARTTDTVRAILRFKGVLYRKHLARGVSKGALTEKEAKLKYQEWINEKESKLDDRKKGVNHKKPKRKENTSSLEEYLSDLEKELNQQEITTKSEEDELLMGTIFIEEDIAILAPPSTRINSKKEVEIDNLQVKIIIDDDYKKFNIEKQNLLIKEIQKELNLGEITIIKVEKGSVIITIELSKEDANKLLRSIYLEKLQELGITDIQLISFVTQEEDLSDIQEYEEKSQKLEELKALLKEKVVSEQIDKVLQEVKRILVDGSQYKNEVIALLTRYKNKQSKSRVGIQGAESLTTEQNALVVSTLNLIDELSSEDCRAL